MKQVVQNLSNGITSLIDVPCPKNIQGSILIASKKSLISSGTERMLVDFGRANLISKAFQQPDKVKQVFEKLKADGILATFESVHTKLDQPLPLGYCNAGIVLESSMDSISVGDRVVSSGNHAEVIRVPHNLCTKIPDEVDDESAAFTVLASVGLQGIRLINPTLGEAVAVFGLGVIGLMTVQMLRANGCRVLGIDNNSSRCVLARQFGAETVDLSNEEDPISAAKLFSRGRGMDAVIIAAATESNELMHQASEMCRKRGRIVLVGMAGLKLQRDDFFKKEITFQVSASYGPGRYDSNYEEKGQDYPLGFVRWTAQRNFEAVLDMMAATALDVKPLISHRFFIREAVDAYSILDDSSALGILLEYPSPENKQLRNAEVPLQSSGSFCYLPTDPVVGFIGAGNYASRVLIPAFKDAGAKLDTLATTGSISGVHYGKKAGFKTITSQLDVLWNNDDINIVVIVTRHDAHASQVLSALESGKHIFVEKPLAVNNEQLSIINEKMLELKDPPVLMVGFNRRFAPHIVKMKSLLKSRRESKFIAITVNAGEIPADHWIQDPEIGGGRIIGEGCHFIDLMRFLVGYPITGHQAIMMGSKTGVELRDDKVSINLSFADGSFGAINYLANGGKVFPKERIEVFCGGAVLQLDNYRVLRGYGWRGFNKMKLFKQNKGQKACTKAFLEAITKGYPSPIPYDEVMESSKISVLIAESLRKNS